MDIRESGAAKRLEAFPRRLHPGCGHADEGDVWTGPMNLFESEGFKVEKEVMGKPVMVLEF